MLELADGADSKSVASNSVWVQVPPSAPAFFDMHDRKSCMFLIMNTQAKESSIKFECHKKITAI